jgi:hypothetical protein
MFLMKKIIVPSILAFIVSFLAITSYTDKTSDETGPMLNSAESFFKVMKAGEYKRIWQFLSGKSSL